ncbi:MAG: DNA polymerase III subunit gamma/tau [Planctomycetes bacterium]|nr:DNA polymerase III subunit gamma/tau [Planctomycetota bacterium]
MAAKKSEGKAAKKETADGEAYVVFARRFRPQTFADVVGQETVTAALRHALRTGRLAQAFLFSGPRGVGKTSLARIFAKALNCLKGSGVKGVAEEPCNECDSCLSIQNGSALDVIEMDAATNRGIGDVQKLRENVGLAPEQLRYKIYIVDEVHMLTTEAWNAFLKTLEEPPAHVKFVFATTDPDKIPETILSRCQRFDLRRIGLADIVKRLKQICDEEDIKATTGALERIASISKGGLRDAEGMLDQAVNLGEGKVDEEVVRGISGAAPDELLFDLLQACADSQVSGALGHVGKAIDAGADPDDLLVELCERLRGTLIAKTCGAESSLLEGQTHLKDAYAQLGQKLGEDQILQLMQLFTNARRQVKDAAQARLPLEMAVVRAARVKELVDLGKLVAALESGAPVAARSAQASGGIREGPRPNPYGRPAGIAESRPAAQTPSEPAAVVEASSSPVQATLPAAVGVPERWNDVLAEVRPLTGGGFMAGALGHVQSVRLELETGKIELGFATAQMFYRDSLENPERLAVLNQALEKVYGKKLSVSFARVKESAASTARVTQPLSRPAAAAIRVPEKDNAVARSEPATELHQDADEAVEAEVAFDDEGALPMDGPPAKESADEADALVSADTEDAPATPAKRISLDPSVEAAIETRTSEPVNEKEIMEHPIVKALVERVEGEVRRVERRARKADRKE